jgi:hypothetical protein
VLVYSDHQSLRFMQQVQRGSLSAQHFALIGDVQYELRWLPGANNVAADYLSRYHTTSPHEFNTQGLEAAVAELLGRLKNQHRDDDRWWVYSHVDMDAVVAVVQQWRRSTRLPLRSSTKGGAMDSKDWTFALLVPSPLTAAKDAAALLRSGRPGCVLVPADLVSSIIDKGGGYDAELGVRLRASPMISFPVANFLWIGSGVTFDNAVCLPVTLRTSARLQAKAGLAPRRLRRTWIGRGATACVCWAGSCRMSVVHAAYPTTVVVINWWSGWCLHLQRRCGKQWLAVGEDETLICRCLVRGCRLRRRRREAALWRHRRRVQRSRAALPLLLLRRRLQRRLWQGGHVHL